MIPNNATANRDRDWREALRGAFTDTASLRAWLGLEAVDSLPEVAFPCLVTRHFAAKMRFGDPADPLLRQVLPTHAESAAVPGYVSDPLREDAVAEGGLLRKYYGRALLVTTGACPVHCRYCFRREFPYAEQAVTGARLASARAAIAADRSISEVILSGGDPLVLGTPTLARIVHGLEEIEHVTRLRVHTRVPAMLPSRLEDTALLELLAGWSGRLVVVLHANHPAEICAQTAAAVSRLREANALMLNQSVLLAGVNDSPEVLASLSETLFDAGVLPYYLHLLDPVTGAAHFDVETEQALRILRALQSRLPGYLVPALVREDPGATAKTRLA